MPPVGLAVVFVEGVGSGCPCLLVGNPAPGLKPHFPGVEFRFSPDQSIAPYLTFPRLETGSRLNGKEGVAATIGGLCPGIVQVEDVMLAEQTF